jgi:hypothetical protein
MDIRPSWRKGSHSIRRYLFLSRILKGFFLSAKEFNVNLQNLRFIFFFFTKWMRSSSRGIATLMTDLNIKMVGVDLVKQLRKSERKKPNKPRQFWIGFKDVPHGNMPPTRTLTSTIDFVSYQMTTGWIFLCLTFVVSTICHSNRSSGFPPMTSGE